MREEIEETRNYVLKNKRKTKEKESYEELTECGYIPALSFEVNENRFKYWKEIFCEIFLTYRTER